MIWETIAAEAERIVEAAEGVEELLGRRQEIDDLAYYVAEGVTGTEEKLLHDLAAAPTGGILLGGRHLLGFLALLAFRSEDIHSVLQRPQAGGEAQAIELRTKLSLVAALSALMAALDESVRPEGSPANAPDPGSVTHLLGRLAKLGFDLAGTIQSRDHVSLVRRDQRSSLFDEQRYREHFLHAHNVCLLGWLLLDSRLPGSSQTMADLVASILGEPEEVVYRNWVLAALFHDIGYATERCDQPRRGSRDPWHRLGQDADRPAMLPDPGTTPLALERVRALQSGELDHGILSYLHLKRVLDTAIPDAAERGRYAVAHEAILMHSSTMRVAFSSHPIAALLILCDTLQEWGPPRARDWEPAYPEPHFADHVGLVRRRAAAELAGIELRDAEPAITAPSWEFQLAYSTADTLDLLPLRLCIEKCHGMQRLDLRGFPCRIHVKLTIQHRGFGASRVSGIEALRSYALSRPELGMLEFFEGGPGDAKAVAFEANREQDTISFHAHMLSGLPLLPQRLDLDWSDVARRLGSPAPVPAGVQAIVHPDDDDQRGDLEGVLRNELWRVLRTPEVESSRRCSVLAELIRRKDRALPSFILSELSVDDLPESWRGTLILAAEDVVFPERGQRARLKQLLLDAGTALRDSLRVESEPAFWAAIRRFASLASQADAPCLLRFLRPADGVAARQLAFQALQNIFASSPPSDPEALIALRDRVADLALKYLDVDLLTPGENASLAQNACHALAALGDERLPDCARRLLASDRPWLIRRVMDVLHDLHVERVADASTLCVADPGSRAIEESLDILGHARDPS